MRRIDQCRFLVVVLPIVVPSPACTLYLLVLGVASSRSTANPAASQTLHSFR